MSEDTLIEHHEIHHSIGEQLKSAREVLNLSVVQVAEKLHLSPRIVEELEKNNFTAHPGPIFMRGYLRSYCRLIGLPTHVLLNQFDNLHLQVVHSKPMLVSSFILRQQNPVNEHSMRWVTMLVVIGLLVLVGLWWRTHNGANTNTLKQVDTVNLPETQNLVSENAAIESATGADSAAAAPSAEGLVELSASTARAASAEHRVPADINLASKDEITNSDATSSNRGSAAIAPAKENSVSPTSKPVSQAATQPSGDTQIF